MKNNLVLIFGLVAIGGCSTARAVGIPYPRSGDVVVVDDRDDKDNEGRRFGRAVSVPKGHYPPPGECRIWYVNRPAGHQPPPAKCERLVGRVPHGAFLLYNSKAWDTEYDWRREERRRPGTVPAVVLRIMNSIQ